MDTRSAVLALVTVLLVVVIGLSGFYVFRVRAADFAAAFDAPAAATGTTATPPPEQAPPDASHERLADVYLRRQESNDVARLLDLYAAQVRYYDWGWVDHAAIDADKRAYFARWPTRSYRLDSPVQATTGADGGTTLRFSFAFSTTGGPRRRDGRAWAELDLLPAADGFRIQGERGGVY